MKLFILLTLLSFLTIYTYDRAAVVAYAEQYWNSANHDCSGTYIKCTPYSYWGSERCGYESHGGDCANFASQCILAGGHPKLKGGTCRGYPCGVEEVGAQKLGICLREMGWKRTCGYKQAPPSDIQPGDILVYHQGSCTDFYSHVVVVIEGGAEPKIAAHSASKWGASYTYMASSKPYYEWLQYPDGSGPEPEPEPEPTPDPEPEPAKEVIKMVKVTASSVNRRSGPSKDYEKIGIYMKGDKISVVEQIGEWYKDTEGSYFMAEFVADLKATVTASALNVRESPNTSATVVTVTYEGDTVTCYKTSNGWYYIRTFRDIYGWVAGNYLKF